MLITRCVPRERLLAWLLPLTFGALALAVQGFTLAWNASTDPTVVGYAVYYGTSTNYTTRIDVHTNTTFTVTNLQPGLTYYFAVTDYNAAHVESVPAGPINFLVPGLLKLQSKSATNSGTVVSFPVAPTHSYTLQVSTNLLTWSDLWQTSMATSNAWVQYVDPTTNKAKYYRLRMN